MKALILVDIQNDFLPGGSLAVEKGDQIIPIVNALMPYFDEVIATQDWHPEGHVSFDQTHGKETFSTIEVNGLEQILWPVHTVQGTTGAEFHPDLDRTHITKYVKKGVDPLVDSYSTFFDNKKKHKTDLEAYLKEKGVDELYIAGLALDFCVRYSCLDALGLGFRVFLIEEACRGVNEKDSKAAVEEIKQLGGKVVTVDEVVKRMLKKK